MKINLAGYNVDTSLLQRLDGDNPEALTPESFSAAYARISRSPKDITALRKQAREDVAKARASNHSIIFDMGHHSVAEHAVFNLDVINISRLALEELEKFRLVSYTEKSQRYVTLEGDYLVPEEIDDPADIQCFREMVHRQNEFYKKAFVRLNDFISRKHSELAKKKKNKKLLEGWAKEDARYILPLATLGQVGVTINARNLEHLFRRLSMSRRCECRDMGREILRLIKDIAPSLILFPEPSAFEKKMHGDFRHNFRLDEVEKNVSHEPRIVDYTEGGDLKILAACVSVFNSIDYPEAFTRVKVLTDAERKQIFRQLFETMEFFDSPPREFEFADITFQAVISAANFAQLKRHRMATLLSGSYDTSLGYTMPDNIRYAGLAGEFEEIIDETGRVNARLNKKYGTAADYILTNSHHRMVLMKMNLRELYHFTRLRDDDHAQWDIRRLAKALKEQTIELFPFSSLLLCGKSTFVTQYKKIFNEEPQFII